MNRKEFLKINRNFGIGLLITPSGLIQLSNSENKMAVKEGFLNPPLQARPGTYYFFMNGNVTADGITRDFEAIKRMGMGGVYHFEGGVALPKGKLKYGSPEWLDIKKHTLQEAQRLGIDYTMHNCPGWSSSGGPWVTPELSMQKIVWTESFVKGGAPINLKLRKPANRLDYYRDINIIAFPTLKNDDRNWLDTVASITLNNKKIDTAQGREEQGIRIDAKNDAKQTLYIEYSKPIEASSVAIECGAAEKKGNQMMPVIIEGSNDGVTYTPIHTTKWLWNGEPVYGNFAPVALKYFRFIFSSPALLRYVKFYSDRERISDWLVKANFNHKPSDSRFNEPAPFAGDKREIVQRSETDYAQADHVSAINSTSVLNLTAHMSDDGGLNWDAPPGSWTILRIGHMTTASKNRAAPEGGGGLEVDKYNAAAFDFHFNEMFKKILPLLKPLTSKGRMGILIDSYEVGMQNWTKNFPEELKNRKQYEIIKYLPALTGRFIDSAEITERFLWDFRRVQADMIAEYYYGQCAKRCHEHNISFAAEPYKLGPFEEMQAGAALDIAMGEFWARGQRNKHAVKLVSSIQHVNGKKIVAAESYTGHSVYSKWTQYPFSLKAQGDFMFTKGLNKMVFHTYAHQPHPDVKPGMTMGPFGTHIDRNVTWFEQGSEWIKYISRVQYILQEGLFVADLLYFVGDEAPGMELALRDIVIPELPVGYDFDYINVDSLIRRVKIRNNKIFLPDGMNYQLLVLPPTASMSLKTLKHIEQLVKEGMYLFGNKPSKISGLEGYPASDQEFFNITEKMWGGIQSNDTKEKTYGSGNIFWEGTVQSVLSKIGCAADFSCTASSPDAAINYIHRKIKDDDFYFIANRKRRQEQVVCSFKVQGKIPEVWDPVTAQVTSVLMYDTNNGRINIPLDLSPSGSLFIVFRKSVAAEHIISLEKNGVSLINTKPFSKSNSRKYASVINNFTQQAWIKPESDIVVSGMDVMRREDVSGFVFYPGRGETLYGGGHAVFGATAGLNGVVVYERITDLLDPVLEIQTAISGKTHLAVVYKDAVPHVYLDGVLAGMGKQSAYKVHPSLHEEFEDTSSSFFEGDIIDAKQYNNPLSAEQIKKTINIPPVISSYFPEAAFVPSHGLVFWSNGNYTIKKNTKEKQRLKIEGIQDAMALKGPWQIHFPSNSGAPTSSVLKELISLHLHSDAGIKYFSGTATYIHEFNFNSLVTDASYRSVLDLGQVEVIAEVLLNGNNLGILWQRPYRLDVTKHLMKGNNILQVKVTNLWPNRLIGNEQLPAEYEYSDKPFEGQGSGAIKKMPDWFISGRPRPKGQRISFATWKHYNKDSSLLESGLIGPVTLKDCYIYNKENNSIQK